MTTVLYDKEGFTVSITEQRGTQIACLSFKGDCVEPGFASHSDEIVEKLNNLEFPYVFFDVNDLAHINSKFLGLLISFMATDKKIGLKKPGQFLNDLLDMIGILQAFAIFEDFNSFVKECDI